MRSLRGVSTFVLGAGLLGSLAGGPGTAAQQPSPPAHGYVPPSGFVPDSITAVRIAEAVWIPIYGEARIRGEHPLRARLAGGVWTVEGSLPPGWVGGVALAEIARSDGRILRVSHGQ